MFSFFLDNQLIPSVFMNNRQTLFRVFLLRDSNDVVPPRPDPAVATPELTDPGDHVTLPLIVFDESFTFKLGPNLPFSCREEFNNT